MRDIQERISGGAICASTDATEVAATMTGMKHRERLDDVSDSVTEATSMLEQAIYNIRRKGNQINYYRMKEDWAEVERLLDKWAKEVMELQGILEGRPTPNK